MLNWFVVDLVFGVFVERVRVCEEDTEDLVLLDGFCILHRFLNSCYRI